MNQSVLPDFADPAVQANPFEAYEKLRDAHPVYKDPTTGFYVVLDYDLLREVAGDSLTYSSDTGVLQVRSGEIGEEIRRIQADHGIHLEPALLVTDPPRHTFHRRFVEKAFSPSRVRKLEGYLTEVVADLATSLADQPSVEFVSQFAVMVPVFVVADLIGASRDMVQDIKRWSDASAAGVDPSLDQNTILDAVTEACQLQQFILEQARRFRIEPADNLLSDVANAEVNGLRLSDPELVSLMEQIFVAGHETTTNTMAHAMLRLIQTPGLEGQLREEPGLISSYIEEVLRLDSPLQGMFRMTTKDVTLSGVPIPARSVVVLRWGAGNRDAKRFAFPAEVDLHRPNIRNHLAFGTGIHFCIGNQLGRAELRIAFEQLLRKYCNFRLANGPSSASRAEHYFIYRLQKLEIAFDAVA
ncbi:cytochrome P450 [Sphingobium sp. V4]|uniref:cytochrome P450 n=1 Tax=Sphingobium sp. V4 TaxID=3038927 RepID=UPI0025582964|nr:cytochrome P450 [Sphingobium sp. V4]WIW89525.1 cytochrome P450 [Sphingobium sp. V4]